MTTFATGNPLGSVDARDLYDNAENLDTAVNSTAHGWTDRLGVERKSYAGMEDDFQQFLLASGYEDLGAYGAGVVITARNQIFTYGGEYYRAAAATVLPYTTTGTWATDDQDFVAIGDAALRQDLALHADTTIGFYQGAINANQYGGLAAAVADADTAGKVIVVSDAQTISTSLTINNRAIVAQFGAVITIASGQTLTINGMASLATGSIAGAGALVLGPGSVKGIDPDIFAGTDTVKTQKAIDTAEGSTWTPLLIGRQYTLTASVTIDRAVGGWSGEEFRIIGQGLHAGFYTASAINMFSSTIAHTTAPVSEHISFEGIHFSASDESLNCFVLNGYKFLRMKFDNCYFSRIRLAYTENYYQTFKISQSYLIRWAGNFMESVNGGGTYGGRMIDCHVNMFSAEFGDASASKVFVAAGPVTGSSFTNSLMENMDGPAITVGAFTGSLISGCYFEAIIDYALKLGQTNSLALEGNVFVNDIPTWTAVDCEISLNIASRGNYSSGNLFNDENMVTGYGDGLISHGDVATGNLYKDIAKNQIAVLGTLTGFAGVDPLGYCYVARNGNTISIAFATISGTSDATTMTLTGAIPAKWLPITPRQSVAFVIDNGVTAPGLVTISSAGVSFSKDTAGNAFTASGTKGVICATITYNLYP